MIAAIHASQTRSPPKPAKERDYLSFSAVRTFQQCPLKYFFRYVAGLPEKSVSASLIFGAAIHSAIEHHFRELLAGNQPPGLPLLVEVYRAGWADREEKPVHFGKEHTRESLDALAERMLLAFCESPAARPSGTILAVEEELRGKIIPGLPDILGRVDLIVLSEDALVVSDWKTSRTKWSRDQVDESAEQLLLYTELARDFAPGRQLRIEFTVLTKTKTVAVEQFQQAAELSRVDRTKRMVERTWRAIQAGHYYPSPSLTGCSGCPYRSPCRKWCG